MAKVIFINYRRDDSSPVARGLQENLIEAFGDAVFMDVDEIRVGDTWPQTLDNALTSATVLLVVIGPSWLRIADEFGRRRLDLPNDWVCTEIERCLTKGITVIPVLVGRATMPPKEALPNLIRGLADQQYIELREAHWKRDLQPLIDRLTSQPLAFERQSSRPTGVLPEFTVIKLLRDQRFLPGNRYQPWKEPTEEREASVLVFERNFVTLPKSAGPSYVLPDPAFDVQVKNKNSRPVVCHRVGIRIVSRQGGKFGGGSMGFSETLPIQSEFKIHCPSEWKPLRGTINDQSWTDFPDPIEMKEGDSAFRFTLMLENFCDTHSSLSSEVKLYLDTDNGRVESKSIWLHQ
jgi:TIR domain